LFNLSASFELGSGSNLIVALSSLELELFVFFLCDGDCLENGMDQKKYLSRREQDLNHQAREH